MERRLLTRDIPVQLFQQQNFIRDSVLGCYLREREEYKRYMCHVEMHLKLRVTISQYFI